MEIQPEIVVNPEPEAEVIRDTLVDVFNKIIKNYSGAVRFLDKQICNNLREGGIQTRNSKYNGLWCCFLLPTILFLYYLMDHVSLLYATVAFQSLGLLAYSILFILFMSVSSSVVKDRRLGGCAASTLIAALLVYAFCEVGLITAVAMSFVSIFSYGILLRYCIMSFPRTFTLGELMIVLQGGILFVDLMLYVMLHPFKDPDNFLIWSVLFSGYATLGFIIVVLSLLKDERRTMTSFWNIMIVATGILLFLLHYCMGIKSIPLVLVFIFGSRIRRTLISQWIFLLVTAVVLIMMRTKSGERADSATRKSFHILSSIVFTAGILQDLPLMKLAAGIALGGIIFAEALRKSRIDPIASSLQSAFEIYKDEKDSGAFAVTPIYMYAGIACPLVIVPKHFGAKLELFSGVLSTGIGDSAASVIGRLFGNTYWPGSKKTVEGTAANVIAQVLFVYFLDKYNYLQDNEDWILFRTLLAGTTSAIIESTTVQVDNIVLPLVTIIAFQLSALLVWPLT